MVRLTAPDGYRAMRSYSVASPPDDSGEIELTVERLDDGEVSGFLHDVVEPGDELEVRGPIGGFFVWEGDGPAVLVGGGSGLVPLMAMLRLARATDRADLVRLAVSVRSPGDLLYADELTGPRHHGRLHPPGRPRIGPTRPAGSRPTTSLPSCCPTPPPTSAGRPASPTPPAACSSASTCPSTASGSSGSARAPPSRRRSRVGRAPR